MNTSVDNIGARRLHTVLERIVEDISFDAPEKVSVYCNTDCLLMSCDVNYNNVCLSKCHIELSRSEAVCNKEFT